MPNVDPQAASYDAVPYESKPLQPTHPSQLAVMATLAGLTPPDPRRCRVLEIGCATGGNLLPMAVSLPEAQFVGIDLSPAQIATGRRVQQELGLQNVELRAGSIVDEVLPPGSFDYVVCHGVYSWVPDAVREAILAASARVLSPHGIAYVSYNTYPGWHLRSMVRDMLLYHVRGVDEPQERIRRSREFVAFLHGSARDRDSAFVKFLGEEAQLLGKASDTYVFHEHLEADNQPRWFHQFVAEARRHGLEFVGEAVPDDGWEETPEVAQAVARFAGDPVARGQYFDFLRNRTFRRSLLCRAGLPVDHVARPERLKALWLGSAMKPERSDPDLDGETVEAFVGPGGQRLQIGHAWLKTAFGLLGRRWPEVLPFDELASAVARARGGEPAADEMVEILGALRQCHAGGVLKLEPARCLATNAPGPRPVASPLARLMARSTCRVASLRHELVEVREVDRLLLPMLDGTRDRSGLALALRRAAEAQGLDLPRGADAAVAESLGVLGMAALLMRAPGQPGAPPVTGSS